MAIIICVLFLLSGFAGLTYQLIWVNTLSLIFGVSYQAISTVTAAFMGGLALGSFVFGRFADRSKSPLRLYAALEAGIAISVLLLPYLFSVINHLYVFMVQTLPTYSWAFTTTRFLLCFAALLIPTTLMGGTLPVISRFFIVRLDRLGHGVGLLYAANTVGGVFGCLATGFVLVRLLGVHDTTLLAAAICLTVALAAGLIANRYTYIDSLSATATLHVPGEQSTTCESGSTSQTPAVATYKSLAGFIIVAFAIAGATSLAYEVLWTRVLVYFISLSTYSFTIILATFLCGLALGSFCFAPIADRRRELLIVFGILELAIGLSAVYLLQAIGGLFWFTSEYLPLSTVPVGKFAAAFVLMLVPTFLMGAVFPVVSKLYIASLPRLGGSLGNIYAANTLGCVVGSLLAGFALLPVLGAQKSIVLVATFNVLLGISALLLSPSRTAVRQWALYLAIPVLVIGGFLSRHISPTVTYCHSFRSEGFDKLLYYHEGAEASLAVLGGPLGYKGLNINGKTTAYTSYYDIVVHKMLGHLPLFLAKDPHSALIIGFGFGSTAWSMAQYPLQRIDCVELVPEETETARYFHAENGGVLTDPRFHLIIGDGRNYLLTSRNKYDVISMNAIHPAFSPYLYTREFYQLCKSRLREDGIMCAWLPTYTDHLTTLLKTFQSVFPHASLWFCNPFHTVLVGTPQPLSIDFSRLQSRMSKTAVRNNLAEVWLDDPVRLLSTLILDEDTVRAFSGQASLNTDDLPCVAFEGFGVPLKLVTAPNLQRIFAMHSRVYPYITNVGNGTTRAQLAKRFERHFASMQYTFAAAMWRISATSQNQLQAIEQMERAVAACPEDPRLRYQLGLMWVRVLGMSPNLLLSPDLRGRALSALEAALPSADATTQSPGPPETFLARIRRALAQIYFSEGRFPEAERQAKLVLLVDPYDPACRRLLELISSYP